jgi:hypothetical protein
MEATIEEQIRMAKFKHVDRRYDAYCILRNNTHDLSLNIRDYVIRNIHNLGTSVHAYIAADFFNIKRFNHYCNNYFNRKLVG